MTTAESEITLTRAKYFPATVVHESLTRPLRGMVVIAQGGEHAGLWVYDRPDHLVFNRGINYLRTKPIPSKQRDARNGVDLELADGTTATVTPGTGCKCGALGRWSGPEWSNTVAVRT